MRTYARRMLLCNLGIFIVILVLISSGNEMMAQPPALPVIHDEMEQTELEGWFSITWGDPLPGSDQEPIILYTLSEEDGRTRRLLVGDEAVHVPVSLLDLNNKRVVVEGRVVQEDVVIVSTIELDASIQQVASVLSAQDVSGSKPYISILCKFADVSDEPKPLSYFQDMYEGDYPELDHYWRELSYDLINLDGSSAVGWYVLPEPKSYYVYDRDGDGDDDADTSLLRQDCTAAADDDVYFPAYEGINMMFNDYLDGYARGGSSYLDLDGESKVYGTTWNPPWAYNSISVIEHEMGHSFGLPHSSGDYGQTYDNVWDVMSKDRAFCSVTQDPTYGCLGQHTISYHKDKLGWIPDTQRFEAKAFHQTLTLEQLAQPATSNYKMAQIPIAGSEDHFYTVEVRRQISYDAKLPGNAVVIHEVDKTRSRPAHVVDVDGNGDTGDEGAMWVVGETFVDTLHDISVTVDSATATGFVVTIDTKPIPIRLTPADGEFMNPGDVTFSWTQITDATGYEIQIDSVSSFDSPDLISTTVTETSYTTDFSTLGSYFWRVRALPDAGFSPHWQFSIAEPFVQITQYPERDYSPSILEMMDGSLWAVWFSRRAGNTDIWYKISYDVGDTWSPAMQVTTHNSSDYSPSLTQTPDGKIWVSWQSYRSGNGDIWYMTTIDSGATWSEPVQLTTNTATDTEPAIFYSPSLDNLWITWRSERSGNYDIWYMTSDDGGSSWSSAIQLTVDSDGDHAPAITEASDENIWIVWESYRSGSDILYRTTSDGGTSWSAPAQLTPENTYEFGPGITTVQDGSMWLSWYGYNASGQWTDIYYSSSHDNGNTWSASTRFTTFAGFDTHPAVAVMSGNLVGLVWVSDRGEENEEILFGSPGTHGDVKPPPSIRYVEQTPSPHPNSDDIITVTARVLDDTGLDNVVLSWTMDEASQPDISMYDDGAHGDGAADDDYYGAQLGPLPVDSQVSYTIIATDKDMQTYTTAERSFQVLAPMITTADILFVPDYGGYETNWFQSYFTDAFDALGYTYAIWDTALRGEPDSSILDEYIDGITVWSAPYWGYVSTRASTQDTLESYLDSGGRLFITSQNTAYYLNAYGYTEFMEDFLHLDFVQGEADLYDIIGTADDPIGTGLSFNVAGGDGGNNQYTMDEIDPISPAVTVLTYDDTTLLAGENSDSISIATPVTIEQPYAYPVPELASDIQSSILISSPDASGPDAPQDIISSGTAGQRVDTGIFRIVYFAFGFEGINNASDRNLVMERVLGWLDRPDPELTIRQTGNGIELQWSHTNGNISSYQIWRGAIPYFDPDIVEPDVINIMNVDAPSVGSEVVHEDTSGDPDTDYFYVVRGMIGDTSATMSNFTGLIHFPLEPGAD